MKKIWSTLNNGPQIEDHLVFTKRDRETVSLLFLIFFLALACPGIATRSDSFKQPPKNFYRHQVDPNAATAIEMQTLPGIGEKLSGAIVRYREENGPFQSHDEIRAVKGIGPKKLEAMRPLLLEIKTPTQKHALPR